jgi:hypothetical protein
MGKPEGRPCSRPPFGLLSYGTFHRERDLVRELEVLIERLDLHLLGITARRVSGGVPDQRLTGSTCIERFLRGNCRRVHHVDTRRRRQAVVTLTE